LVRGRRRFRWLDHHRAFLGEERGGDRRCADDHGSLDLWHCYRGLLGEKAPTNIMTGRQAGVAALRFNDPIDPIEPMEFADMRRSGVRSPQKRHDIHGQRWLRPRERCPTPP
jgi:hypothetical protein